MALNPRLLEIIACPEDKGALWYFEDEAVLYNPRLKKKYRVENDVPVLLMSEAVTVSASEDEKYNARSQSFLTTT